MFCASDANAGRHWSILQSRSSNRCLPVCLLSAVRFEQSDRESGGSNSNSESGSRKKLKPNEGAAAAAAVGGGATGSKSSPLSRAPTAAGGDGSAAAGSGELPGAAASGGVEAGLLIDDDRVVVPALEDDIRSAVEGRGEGAGERHPSPAAAAGAAAAASGSPPNGGSPAPAGVAAMIVVPDAGSAGATPIASCGSEASVVSPAAGPAGPALPAVPAAPSDGKSVSGVARSHDEMALGSFDLSGDQEEGCFENAAKRRRLDVPTPVEGGIGGHGTSAVVGMPGGGAALAGSSGSSSRAQAGSKASSVTTEAAAPAQTPIDLSSPGKAIGSVPANVAVGGPAAPVGAGAPPARLKKKKNKGKKDKKTSPKNAGGGGKGELHAMDDDFEVKQSAKVRRTAVTMEGAAFYSFAWLVAWRAGSSLEAVECYKRALCVRALDYVVAPECWLLACGAPARSCFSSTMHWVPRSFAMSASNLCVTRTRPGVCFINAGTSRWDGPFPYRVERDPCRRPGASASYQAACL